MRDNRKRSDQLSLLVIDLSYLSNLDVYNSQLKNLLKICTAHKCIIPIPIRANSIKQKDERLILKYQKLIVETKITLFF